MKPFKLPDALLQTEPRTLADLNVGETMPVVDVDMVVPPDRSCYLYKDGTAYDLPTAITVVRREDGCHVIAGPQNRWAPKELPISKKMIPVVSVTVRQD